ncbi:MAG: thioredoxin family protein [Bacteroidales bacterium]|nr:thioredoxin family protein [Bacteroidales bacterium]
MRIIRIITLIAALAVIAGCGTARKPRSGAAGPLPPAAAEQQTPPEAVPETAPFGNAALAGKPDEEEDAADHVWDFRDATTWLLGDFRPARLFNPPHSSWYVSGYRDYHPDQAFMKELQETDISDLTITIVLGTWCPDSRREVPRFMKIIDLWGFPEEKIRFIGVDIDKIAPLQDYQELGIERVPTFIFYENNSEKGRIIEVPLTSLEQETGNILKEK